MAKLDGNQFSSWSFTTEEQAVADVLPDLNYKRIQNIIADYARDKIAISYEPSENRPSEKILMHSEYLRGAIEALTYVLAVSDSSRQALLDLMLEQVDAQQNSKE